MKLKAKERISIIQICPVEADILTQTIIKEIVKKVELTQADIKKMDVKPREDGKPGLQWKGDLPAKNITFSEVELEILKSRVDKMDKEKKITQDMLEVCLKIRDEKTVKKGNKDGVTRRKKD